MKVFLIFLCLFSPLHAALWIYYPAAYVTKGDKSDGVSLVETSGLFSVSRNDRQIYTIAYTQDFLDGKDWKYTQHTGLIAATWPLSLWTLSCSIGMVNGRLSEVPKEFSPLNKGMFSAVRLLRHEGQVRWGMAVDLYDEPSGLHIRHGGILAQWTHHNRFSACVTANAAMQLGQPNRYSATLESRWDATRKVSFQTDYMFGQNSLPFSWNTLLLNNTPALMNDMWGAKCEWDAISPLRLTIGYRHTGYENADADYIYCGISMRLLDH